MVWQMVVRKLLLESSAEGFMLARDGYSTQEGYFRNIEFSKDPDTVWNVLFVILCSDENLRNIVVDII